jgi:hypothetical protein
VDRIIDKVDGRPMEMRNCAPHRFSVAAVHHANDIGWYSGIRHQVQQASLLVGRRASAGTVVVTAAAAIKGCTRQRPDLDG